MLNDGSMLVLNPIWHIEYCLEINIFLEVIMEYLNRFLKLDKIGSGGMGDIWRAYDRETGAVVALKELRTDLSRSKDIYRFIREINNLAKITHPNIIHFIKSNNNQNNPSYAMEYCPKGNLHDWLQKRKRSINELSVCYKHICTGVAFLHENNLIHRDLKPQNILLGEDLYFKISDFGLCINPLDSEKRVTTSNWVSEGFSAPEQYTNMSEVTETADVYSMGAILYFMLTGKYYHTTHSIEVPDIPGYMHLMLKWMLCDNPNDRFKSAKEVMVVYNSVIDMEINKNDFVKCPKCKGPAITNDIVDSNAFGLTCLACGYNLIEN